MAGERFVRITTRANEYARQRGALRRAALRNFDLHWSKELRSPSEPEDPLSKIKIDSLGLPTLAENTLIRNGIESVRDVADKSRRELLEIRLFGQGSMEALEEALAEREINPWGDQIRS